MKWLIAFIVAGILFILIWEGCSKKQDPIINDSIKVKEATIQKEEKQTDTLKAEVTKNQEVKRKLPRHKTKFDSLATKDTVLTELKKCDTLYLVDSVLIKYQASIIGKQDTIIIQLKDVVSTQDREIEDLTKEFKKEKRKTVFTKIIATVAVIASIIILK